MNTSATNFVKMVSSKQRFDNDSSEIKATRSKSHKHMQQGRRLARYNKQAVQTSYNATSNTNND